MSEIKRFIVEFFYLLKADTKKEGLGEQKCSLLNICALSNFMPMTVPPFDTLRRSEEQLGGGCSSRNDLC